MSRDTDCRRSDRASQGFVNLAHSGDDDGGLVVLKEGHKISEEYHNAFREEDRGFRWTNEVGSRPRLDRLDLDHADEFPNKQIYQFKDTGLNWLKERGYEWLKVNCEPGDLVLCKSS
jgi:hypothetical protein